MCTKYSKREKVWLHCLGWLVCLIKEKYTSLQCIVQLLERGGGGKRERARPFLHQCITQKGLHRDSNTMILEGALTHTYGLTKHGSTSVEGNNIFYKHFSIYQQIAMVLL